MPGKQIEFRANGRTAPAYLATPASGSGAGVIVVQEWWGLVGHITDVADRFAREGFVALAPDLYHGERTKSPDQAGKLMMALNIAEAAKDLGGAADHLLALDAVRPKKVAAVGFCMGGQLALFALQEHPDRIAAAVDFYGVHPHVRIEPERVRGPVLFHFAERDTMTPPDAAHALTDRLRAAGAPVEAHFYDADHAFFNDQRPEVYSEADARLAWERTIEFLRRVLR